MREEAILVDHAEDSIREHMNPEQCAKWTVFCEKYKYRKEISLDLKFKPKTTTHSI
jgi:phage-related protein